MHLGYRVFKYLIYCLLAGNVYLFFAEDLAASAQTFAQGVGWHNAVEAYSATVDTAAWLILLLLFELETAVFPARDSAGLPPPRQLRGVRFIRVVCYTFITYSLYGYIVKYGALTDLHEFRIADLCALVGTNFSYVFSLDDYLPLSAEICTAMQGQVLWQVNGTNIIGTTEQFRPAQRLAMTDVINASTWLVVVAALELEVWLQRTGRLTGRLLHIAASLKPALYAILLACAIYWGIDGEFLDFWDAFLWLLAFAFIELNILKWPDKARPVAD